jgi:hypothetical protein
MNELLSIGRRTVNKDNFINAVQNSKNLDGVCKALDFNATVGTTRKLIREHINALQLDTTHFDRKFNIEHTEKYTAMIERHVKSFNLNENNQKYYDAFEKSINPASWATYKATIGNFLESLKDIDFATIDVDMAEDYIQGKDNRAAHLRSLMVYIVANDINDAKAKVSKDVLIWCISNRAKKTV